MNALRVQLLKAWPPGEVETKTAYCEPSCCCLALSVFKVTNLICSCQTAGTGHYLFAVHLIDLCRYTWIQFKLIQSQNQENAWHGLSKLFSHIAPGISSTGLHSVWCILKEIWLIFAFRLLLEKVFMKDFYWFTNKCCVRLLSNINRQ